LRYVENGSYKWFVIWSHSRIRACATLVLVSGRIEIPILRIFLGLHGLVIDWIREPGQSQTSSGADSSHNDFVALWTFPIGATTKPAVVWENVKVLLRIALSGALM
jgi:hypothetical protein